MYYHKESLDFELMWISLRVTAGEHNASEMSLHAVAAQAAGLTTRITYVSNYSITENGRNTMAAIL